MTQDRIDKMAKSLEKPIILTDDDTLVESDLKNVYHHFLSSDTTLPFSKEVKFKKKESIEDLKKSVLKHRIRLLTGKDLSAIETETGKTIDKDADLRHLARLMILEATGNLPTANPPPVPKESRKRNLSEEPEAEEPKRKRGRKSIAVSSMPIKEALTPKRSRRSMLPQVPIVEKMEEDLEEEVEEENEEEELDLTDLGPNPTPQMIELKRKKMNASNGKKAKTSTKPVAKKVAPVVSPVKTVAKKEDPPVIGFTGEKCQIYLIHANIAEKSHGYLDFAKLQGKIPEFQGVNLALIHTPIEWSPTDVFAVSMNVKLMNRRANQVWYNMAF